MNLILVGFSGSGKTYWGAQLAQALRYTFLDTDAEIERLENQTISDIFNTKGESYFRQLESQLLDRLPLQNTVIATGGGLPCFKDHMDRLLTLGHVIYLKAPLAYLELNLKGHTHHKPLLHHSPDLMSSIRHGLELREPYYQKAHLEIDVSKLSSVASFVSSINSLYL